MREITINVGPLASSSATAICAAQQPNAGQFQLNGTKTTNSFQGTGSIAGQVLTVTAVAAGALSVGMALTGANIATPTGVMRMAAPAGYAADSITGTGGNGTYLVGAGQTAASATIYGGAVATLDVMRQVLLTFAANETGNNFTLVGTDWAGDPITEVIAGTTAGTVTSTLYYKTITQVTCSANCAGNVSVGTNGVGCSPWARLDEWANAQVGLQCTVTGTANYTVQQTWQDPNDPVNVAVNAMAWVNSSDSAVVGASATKQSNYAYPPTWVRVLLNSGSGSVSTVISQAGVAPY